MNNFDEYEAATKCGEEIARALHLKPLRNTRDGRKLYETSDGEKTAAGIARTVEGIIKNY